MFIFKLLSLIKSNVQTPYIFVFIYMYTCVLNKKIYTYTLHDNISQRQCPGDSLVRVPGVHGQVCVPARAAGERPRVTRAGPGPGQPGPLPGIRPAPADHTVATAPADGYTAGGIHGRPVGA